MAANANGNKAALGSGIAAKKAIIRKIQQPATSVFSAASANNVFNNFNFTSSPAKNNATSRLAHQRSRSKLPVQAGDQIKTGNRCLDFCEALIVAKETNISNHLNITDLLGSHYSQRDCCLQNMTKNQIWVDADACPRVVKDILFRASKRLELMVTLVANQAIPVPKSKLVNSVQVEAGFDVADNYILQHVATGDLIITADIPLAAELIDKGCVVINPRGEIYTRDNIRERLNMRDFMDSLRSSGIDTGGPSTLNQKDRRKFANQLDRLLSKMSVANRRI